MQACYGLFQTAFGREFRRRTRRVRSRCFPDRITRVPRRICRFPGMDPGVTVIWMPTDLLPPAARQEGADAVRMAQASCPLQMDAGGFFV